MLQADLQAFAGAFRLRAALAVASGRTLVLFGPSGAGKSLLLRSLAGIHRPVQGHLTLDGETLLDTERGVDFPPQQRRMGYVPQHYGLFPHLTVHQNVGFGLRRLPAATRSRRVADLLGALQLEELAERRPAQLSGGQQQRVALARALAVEPRVLLLDEPFAALDAPLRRVLRRELQTLRHRFGFAMVVVTHDLADACALADEIAVLAGGEVVQVAPPREILYRPVSATVARLTGVRNIFPARVVEANEQALVVATDRFAVRAPPYPFPVGTAVDLFVRPDHVVLVRPEHETDPHRANLLRGRIVDEQQLGPLHTLCFRLSESTGHPQERGSNAGGSLPYDLEVDLAAHPYQALRVAERREWLLAIPPEALHLVPLSATAPPAYLGLGD